MRNFGRINIINVLTYAGVFTGLILISPLKSGAQIAFKVGSNYSTVRNEIFLKILNQLLFPNWVLPFSIILSKNTKNGLLSMSFASAKKGISRIYTEITPSGLTIALSPF